MSEASKTRQTVQANWPIVLEEIRRRGIIKSLNEKVELQRQETIRDLWAVAFNKLSRKELSAMASVHDNKQVIHEELKNVVIKKKNETKFKMAAITTYFNDLKDQMISSFRRKTLALQIKQQVITCLCIMAKSN